MKAVGAPAGMQFLVDQGGSRQLANGRSPHIVLLGDVIFVLLIRELDKSVVQTLVVGGLIDISGSI